MLLALRFLVQFIKWIMACVTSVISKFISMDKKVNHFKARRDWGKGTPFTHCCLWSQWNIFQDLWRGQPSSRTSGSIPHYKQLGITHLMFVDDLIIFYKAHPSSIQHVMRALEEFHACAGLRANLTKSQVVFGGCTHDLQQLCLETTGLTDGSFPLK